MVDKVFIGYFKLAHGLFNLILFCLFCYQGWMGLRIRKARLAGAASPATAVRRHRKAGPVLALWGVLGFIAGLLMVLLDKGKVVEYPLHFLTGSAIVCAIGGLYGVSTRIRTSSPLPVRDVHFGIGLLLLALYVLQSFLGLSLLF